MLHNILLQNSVAYDLGYSIGYFFGANRFYILGMVLILVVLYFVNKRGKSKAE
ncbi:MAG: hypothetical protein LPK07_11275 [Hymenobacteraceae bacterium]|nr:hypothetical protein [Hymenobacteraceae bacterium]